MAALKPANSLFSIALLGACLAAGSLRAQPRNPLREALTPAPIVSGVRAQLRDVQWPEDAERGDEPQFRLVADDEDLAPVAPPLRAPTRNFVQSNNEPARWPDQPYSSRQPLPQFGPSYLPPTEPDFEGWNQEELPHHPRRSYRFTGWGQPLYGTSWLNRPFYVGGNLGVAFLDNPVFDVEQSNTALYGVRLGWDFDYYWGLESRLSYARSNLTPIGRATASGLGQNYFADLALMWYPTGDSRWRPYLSAGLGAATCRFQYNTGSLHDTALELPLGVGLKYFCTPWSTLRWEFQYAPTFGTQRLDPMNNVSIGMGGEIRFGGSPRSYFPWTGSTTYW